VTADAGRSGGQRESEQFGSAILWELGHHGGGDEHSLLSLSGSL